MLERLQMQQRPVILLAVQTALRQAGQGPGSLVRLGVLAEQLSRFADPSKASARSSSRSSAPGPALDPPDILSIRDLPYHS